ncbi:alcohol dehydrogenase 4 [Anaeramoeba ignava]|uniref:Alcohol dehydrogenase 4 n=1 Tax=Anaeramoeba ignava TaxID=1746090 RepID=A0A9Q0RDD7_ANAIG|nr:alcohol dehydrogenase 4 [Anaeramoeba ignava]KAJ5075493.1 alcohol dehydrogenase 4 [Anaeramoeba ignava]
MQVVNCLKGIENSITSFYYGKTQLEIGLGAINKYPEIVKKEKPKVMGLVTGKSSYKLNGAWDVVKKALDDEGIKLVHYDKITTNPLSSTIDECTKLFLDNKVDYVTAIGGGSPIDAAKLVTILMKYPGKIAYDVLHLTFETKEAVPLITINTTAGTGTEVNRFFVVTIDNKGPVLKPVVGSIAAYPTYSIDDPNLLMSSPPKMTIYTAVDSLNHVFEAATTKIRNPFSLILGKEVVEMVAHFLPIANKDPKNGEARYYLHYASALAGCAFDSALLHLTHSLEHPMAAKIWNLPHGQGLGILQPSVIKVVYPVLPKICALILGPIIPDLKGDPSEATMVAEKYEEWLAENGLPEKMGDVGFKEEDIDELVKNARETPVISNVLLPVSPVEATDELLKGIYLESMKPLRKK